MFTILVGRPGIGKGAAVHPAIAILKKANTTNILSDRLTIEYVLEKLSKGFPAQVQKASGGFTFGKKDSSSLISAPELSVFLTASQHTLPILNELWDAKEGMYDYGTRSKGSWPVESPCQSMLAASAGEYLAMSIPRTAVGGGFTRRVNFIYAREKSREIPWPVQPNSIPIVNGLVDDLKHISRIRGEYKFAKGEVERMFEIYKLSCKAADFDDEATASYITSKWAHVTKLGMVISASRGDDLIINKQDFEEAVEQVEEAAKGLRLIFRGVGLSDMVEKMDKVLVFLETVPGNWATRDDILAALWQHITEPELDVALATMLHGKVLISKQKGNVDVYSPMPVKARTP